MCMKHWLHMPWYTLVLICSAVMVVLAVVLTIWFAYQTWFTDIATASTTLTTEDAVHGVVAHMAPHPYVLLGESTHGTQEFYEWRARITQELITEHGFRAVFVEADWPYVMGVHDYVQGGDMHASAVDALAATTRWPEWLYDNQPFAEFVEWLRDYNQAHAAEDVVSVYGIDMQDPARARHELLTSAAEIDTELQQHLADRLACFAAYDTSLPEYAAAYAAGEADCLSDVQSAEALVREFVATHEDLSPYAGQALLHNVRALQSAVRQGHVAGDAQEMWNERSGYMVDTILRTTEQLHRSPAAGVVVWAHNTHIGDGRAVVRPETAELSVAEILRDDVVPSPVFSLGFVTKTGSALAAPELGMLPQEFDVGLPQSGSLAARLGHTFGESPVYIDLEHQAARQAFAEPVSEQAVGVVYDLTAARDSYIDVLLPERYSALLYIATTTTLSL